MPDGQPVTSGESASPRRRSITAGVEKLRGAEPLNDVAAHGLAGLLEAGKHLIRQREAAQHIFSDDALA